MGTGAAVFDRLPPHFSTAIYKSLSYIIFDGWRWLEIPLPGQYESGYHWPRYANWRHDDGDGIVDYPLSLTAVIIEQRNRIVYGNTLVETDRTPIRLNKLQAIYGDPEAVGDWEVRMH